MLYRDSPPVKTAVITFTNFQQAEGDLLHIYVSPSVWVDPLCLSLQEDTRKSYFSYRDHDKELCIQLPRIHIPQAGIRPSSSQVVRTVSLWSLTPKLKGIPSRVEGGSYHTFI